jgi:hypothetical protein
MRIKVGNMQLTFTGHPPMTKGDEKAWGHCVNLGNGEILIWLNPLTAVDDKWFETLIHELLHAIEGAAGKKLPHASIKLISMMMAAALIQSGLIDPAAVRKAYELGCEPAQLWDGERTE